MTPNFSGYFKFHPVGQGCFYTGYLRANEGKHKFNVVYDCGTNSDFEYLEKAIADYPARSRKETIDLCIISPFDNDHVNGITLLLKGIRCRRLIIPYYDPVERLLVYFNSEGYGDDDYRLMMQDPFTYFSGDGFDIDEIVVIGWPENPEAPRETAVALPPTDTGDNENEETSEATTQEEFGRFIDDWQDPEANEKTLSEIKYANPGANLSKVSVRQMPYRLRVAYWRFIFYCRRYDEAHEAEIKNKISLLTDAVNDYLNELRADPAKGVSRLSDLFDKEYVKKLRKIYENVFGANKLNSSSLVTFHEPIYQPNRYDWLRRCWPFDDFHRYYLFYDTGASGTLLTGDIDLNTEKKLTQLQNYYTYYLDKIQLLQVMHHGSDLNWPFGIATSRLMDFPMYVINHGLGRKHHPGSRVVRTLALARPPKAVFLNNEVTCYAYMIQYWEDR